PRAGLSATVRSRVDGERKRQFLKALEESGDSSQRVQPWCAQLPSTKRAGVGGVSETFTLKTRRRAGLRESVKDGPSLSGAARRSMAPFLPTNTTASLTRRPERISKWEIFGSPNRIRTQDLLVNSRVFETLCLRVFSAFCDLRALTALGTGGARCQPKGPESSKSELFASANEFRAEDRLVNKQVFEPLCLRVFSAFCDLLALSACGTGGAGECRGCTGLVPLKIARRWFRSHTGRLLADRLRSTRPAPDFATLLR